MKKLLLISLLMVTGCFAGEQSSSNTGLRNYLYTVFKVWALAVVGGATENHAYNPGGLVGLQVSNMGNEGICSGKEVHTRQGPFKSEESLCRGVAHSKHKKRFGDEPYWTCKGNYKHNPYKESCDGEYTMNYFWHEQHNDSLVCQGETNKRRFEYPFKLECKGIATLAHKRCEGVYQESTISGELHKHHAQGSDSSCSGIVTTCE